MYLEDDRLDEGTFVVKLREANRHEPSRRLILRADRTALYASVRKLFKACQEVGFPGVSLRVNESKGELAAH